MRFFRHTIAEYTCSEHCGYHRSVVAANMSRFHLLVAIFLAIPFGLFFLREPFNLPWYYSFCFLAGELLLLFFAGFLASILFLPILTYGTKVCKKCESPLFFAGRHFDPLGSPRPHWSDIAIFIFIVGFNAAIWITFVSSEIFKAL